MHGNHIPPQQLPQVHSLYKLPLAASLPLRTPAPPAAHSHWPCLTFLLYLPTSTLLLKLLLPETPLPPLPGGRVPFTCRPLWEPPLTSQDAPPSPRHEGRSPWPWGRPGDWQCQG